MEHALNIAPLGMPAAPPTIWPRFQSENKLRIHASMKISVGHNSKGLQLGPPQHNDRNSFLKFDLSWYLVDFCNVNIKMTQYSSFPESVPLTNYCT